MSLLVSSISEAAAEVYTVGGFTEICGMQGSAWFEIVAVVAGAAAVWAAYLPRISAGICTAFSCNAAALAIHQMDIA